MARELLGARLVVLRNGVRLAGYITETEAYIGEEDQACHARAGLTPRTRVMYGPPGRSYVYFTYGMHWMLNAVTEREGFPAAVLIRAVYPTQGIAIIASQRARQPRKHWTNGPAKICQAFGIGQAENELDLCEPSSGLFIEKGIEFPDSSVTIGPRVGLYHTPEPWKSMAWRFFIPNPAAILRWLIQA